ncbi:MAG: glycosyltransferase family A protein [Paeniclostridium sordellii]|uniref:Glycosyltransferase family 2 protein n=1 Tax=Paeniclostridium hominis TaxID=2764329 RepID=A0ABR7K3X2_9FIRM|nr:MULTISPECIES: glycosyltransferase family A protein [Paeniclostridium]MBC6003808.1 glycosyltransferase family 2 protein [Paeniclostridium hominis]MDU2592374.1 glycosyltransferase family A protein [Paeniclostridium sordellii]
MDNIAIVVIGYDRLHCIERLLKSLDRAVYDDCIDLIISIDNSGNEDLYKYVKEFNWKFGNKTVIIRSERLGLKKHVIECGNLTKEYEYIVVLEDDTYVSPYFYNYTKQAIKFYENNENIAGISLYKHKRNIDASKVFENEKNEFDSFFIQYAQSWGQVWSRKEWNNFMEWYNKNGDSFEYSNKVPSNLFQWSNKSWLKYHIRYCIENNKYFVYPNISHSSNFNNMGSHAIANSPAYQTDLMYGKKEYKFMPFNKNAIKYDSFFEREDLGDMLGIDRGELCIDIYGMKQNKENKKYWLTTRLEDFRIIKSFGLELKPHEMNVINQIEGNGIFLYDTSIIEKNYIKSKIHRYNSHLYYQGEANKGDLLEYTKFKYTEWLKYVIKRIKKLK